MRLVISVAVMSVVLHPGNNDGWSRVALGASMRVVQQLLWSVLERRYKVTAVTRSSSCVVSV